MRKLTVLAALCAATTVFGQTTYDQSTVSPMTYIRDYGDDHLDKPDFLEAIRANPPELLVLGKDTVLHHSIGPVVGVGGENVGSTRPPHGVRISSEEMFEKKRRLTAMVSALHDAGCELVMPYICTKTIFGRHDTRIGFWEFYDHWDEYAEDWDLGPKPPDPMEWMRRNADGSLQLTYPFELPKYEPNHRYAACVNQPGWRQHMRNVVRLIAECGYDGCYLDNNAHNECQCGVCQGMFRARMQEKYSAAELRELFAFSAPAEIHLATERQGLLWYESCRFWVDSNVEFLTMLRDHAERTRSPFHMFPNPGTWWRGAQEIQDVARIASFIQSEENGFEYGGHSGMVKIPLIGDLGLREYNDQTLKYKYAQATRSGLRTTMHTRPYLFRARHSPDFIRMNTQTIRLALAEASAFAGGGCKNITQRYGDMETLTRYRDFSAANADLYTGYDCYAPVAMLLFAHQHFYEAGNGVLQSSDAVADELMSAHVPFDLLLEETFSRERLDRYAVVIVPAGTKYISDAVAEALEEWVRDGGRLIACGEDFASHDTFCRQVARDAVTALTASPETTCSLGEGAVFYTSAASPAGGFVATAEALTGSDLSAVKAGDWDPRSLKVNCYIRTDGPPRLVVHAVNYNVKLHRTDVEAPTPLEELEFSLRLPEGMDVTSVVAHDPDADAPLPLEFSQSDRQLTFTLPRIEVYAAIAID